MSSPVPKVVASSGRRRSGGTRSRPEAAAISITAVRPSPSSAQRASTGSPSGPVTRRTNQRPPVAWTRAAAVPSPPSARGRATTAAPGQPRRTPRAMADAASGAVRLPLKESGATSTRSGGGDGPGPRPDEPASGRGGGSRGSSGARGRGWGSGASA